MARPGEVEVIQAEPEAADALVGVEIEAEVVAAALPAQFNVGVDHIAVELGARIHIQADASIEKKWSCELLGETDPKSREVHRLVEFKGACTLFEGASP